MKKEKVCFSYFVSKSLKYYGCKGTVFYVNIEYIFSKP